MIRDDLLAQKTPAESWRSGAKPYEHKVSFKPINPDGTNVYRRSMYTYWKRTGPTPVMMALDASKGMSARLDGKERTLQLNL